MGGAWVHVGNSGILQMLRRKPPAPPLHNKRAGHSHLSMHGQGSWTRKGGDGLEQMVRTSLSPAMQQISKCSPPHVQVLQSMATTTTV
jgi:hypothetical protein